jgi:hypothetical protein
LQYLDEEDADRGWGRTNERSVGGLMSGRTTTVPLLLLVAWVALIGGCSESRCSADICFRTEQHPVVALPVVAHAVQTLDEYPMVGGIDWMTVVETEEGWHVSLKTGRWLLVEPRTIVLDRDAEIVHFWN